MLKFFNWFYKIYTFGDFVKATLLMLLLLLVFTPFYMFMFTLAYYGSYFGLILVIVPTAINIGYYIFAIIRWRIYVKTMKMMKEMNALPDPNVDIIWQMKHPGNIR